jgi:hypothetical protein
MINKTGRLGRTFLGLTGDVEIRLFPDTRPLYGRAFTGGYLG